MDDGPRVVLLVEGESDRAALETLAGRRGLDLAALGIRVEVMNGATNVNRRIAALVGGDGGDDGGRVAVGGLYDAAEQHFVRRALERHGLRPEGSAESLEAQGFFACVVDLEDEMIRALGIDGVLAVVADEDGPHAFATLQQQPAQRGRPVEAQLRRFLGIKSGRKALYGRRLAAAVPLDRVPPPLDGVLRWAVSAARRSGAAGG